jgi:hypothetical protein
MVVEKGRCEDAALTSFEKRGPKKGCGQPLETRKGKETEQCNLF